MQNTITNSPALSLRGFMVCYHQMHDFLPWFGPNASALEHLLDIMSESRLNTLLVEYETYFPWSGKHSRLCAKNALTESQLSAFNADAEAHGIEVIPLIQVLGHVYHILIHHEYHDCAEDANETQQLCPLSPATLQLAKELIDDTLRLHPGCRHLHIGGDECRMLGHCPKCAEYVRQHGLGKLFAGYMSQVADYVLSKGVTPIMWHDIAINHPECLKEFDDRVIFNFWHYGSASHGDADLQYAELLKYVPASRVICSPGARTEMANGALHHFPSLQEANIRKSNQLAAQSGALGTILTDWPDTGCSFFDTLYAIRAQGEASWNGGASLLEFRQSYARNVFGVDAPGLIDKLDAIAGSTISAWGFQHRRGNSLDRYSRAPYRFEQIVKTITNGYKAGEGLGELYRQVGQLGAAANLKELLESIASKCQRHQTELQWYQLLSKLEEFFLSIDIALRKESLVCTEFGTPPPVKEVQCHESRKYARWVLSHWDEVRLAYIDFHSPHTATLPLNNNCNELFPQALHDGLERFVENGLEAFNL